MEMSTKQKSDWEQGTAFTRSLVPSMATTDRHCTGYRLSIKCIGGVWGSRADQSMDALWAILVGLGNYASLGHVKAIDKVAKNASSSV